MVKEVIIYIEGDTKQKGKGNAITLRQGFREFFGGLAEDIKVPIDLKLLGSREIAIKIFLGELEYFPTSFQVLLVDAEGEIDEKDTPKTFLQKISPKFDFKNVKDEQCHLMAQMMESWFLADKEKLAEFYGKGFNINALPKNKNVEEIPKSDVETGLKNAARGTSKKDYKKGEHAGEILRIIDSKKVREAAPHCEKLFTTVIEVLRQVKK
jgi:hypothetical protein